MPQQPLTVVAVGDVIPSRPLFPGGEPSTAAFGRVVDLVAGADLAVANLDSAVTTRGYPREKLITVRANSDVVSDLARVGFDVISVANNHSMDFGETGMFDTLDTLAAAGIQPVGGGADLDSATEPAIMEVNDWRVGVVGWTCVLPTGAAASPERPGQAPIHVHTSYEVNPYLLMEESTTPPTVRTSVDEADLERACALLGRLRGDVDYVIALVHWGGGLSDELAEYQRPLGRALLDAGADVVVGSHPHRVLGIEVHDGKPIIYSAGTLIEQLSREGLAPELQVIFDLLSPDSFVATLHLDPEGHHEVRITPTTLQADGAPVLAEGEDFRRIAERLVALSAALGTRVDVVDGALVIHTRTPVSA